MTELKLVESVGKYVDEIRMKMLDIAHKNKFTEEQYDTFVEMVGIETENMPCYCELFD